jgi:GDPmannose 4,6-dehydratase
MTKRALISGITGQDGSYLAEFLLAKGYDVHGIVRPEQLHNRADVMPNIAGIERRVTLHAGTLENHISLSHSIRSIQPDECYHFAGPSFVDASFEEESSILAAVVSGTHALLAAIKEMAPACRFYMAGSSEMFGEPGRAPQNETMPFKPRSIYGLAKLASFHTTHYYRQRYELFACTGIMYNHESPRRSQDFLQRKASRAAARIKVGLNDKVALGNLAARRDWGYAPEYVEAMWAMIQEDIPRDFVIATGVTHTVAELLDVAFSRVGLSYQDYAITDERYFRPTEKVELRGDITAIKHQLGWKPKKSFSEIIAEMVDADLEMLTSWRRGQS